MLSPRWHKALSDLWNYRIRTILIVLAISLGGLAVGIIVMINSVLVPDAIKQYLSRNPANIKLELSNPVSEDSINAIRSLPDVSYVEPRKEVIGFVQFASGEFANAMFVSIPESGQMKINRLTLADGSPVSDLLPGQVFIERSAGNAVGIKPGENIKLRIGGQDVYEMDMAGYVHDMTAQPYSIEPDIMVYMSPTTFDQLISNSRSNWASSYLLVTSRQNNPTRPQLASVVQSVLKAADKNGIEIANYQVYTVADFFATQVLRTIQAILLSMGVLAALLGVILIINNLIALMEQQVRQIGIMKTIGGTQRQIAGIYLTLVFSYGVLALLIVLPVTALGGHQVCKIMADLLNINLETFHLPTEVIFSLVSTVVGLPILAAFLPICNGLKLTVRETLGSYGVSNPSDCWFERFAGSLQSLPTFVSLPFRNIFRHKARLGLTLGALTLGGACFISIINLSTSLNQAIDYVLNRLTIDVVLTFDKSADAKKLEDASQKVPGVEIAEGWGFAPVQFYGRNRESDSRRVLFLAPPPNSSLLPSDVNLKLLKGSDENGIIASQQLLDLFPGTRIGDEVQVKVRQKWITFRIVGLFRMLGQPSNPYVFVNYDFLNRHLDGPDLVRDLRMKVSAKDIVGQQAIADNVALNLKSTMGIETMEVNLGSMLKSSYTEPTEIMLYLLLILAAVVILVGALGLAGTLNLNVYERKREIGIMRTIGASHADVAGIVLIEAIMMSIIGWILAVTCSFPISLMLNNVIGQLILGTTLEYLFSPTGILIWLIGVVIVACLASVQPAIQAANISIRETIAYE